MKIKNSLALFLLFFCLISFAGCQKEEWDIDPGENEESTIVEGTIVSSGGIPLSNIEVKLDYNEDKWLAYAKVRHKGEVKTDKNGKYRLFFSVKDDEIRTEKDKELGINKDYSLIFDLKHLNGEEYIMPGEMESMILSVDPPIGKPVEPVKTALYRYISSLERKETYTLNLYIPQKRYIQVTLKGFVPQKGDYFEVSNTFPYVWETLLGNEFPDSTYEYKTIGDYRFTLYNAPERTFQIPCALNENNKLEVMRKKNGIYTTEQHTFFVTADSPENLTFEY